ncbi:MAG: hypothetical protein CSB01_01275 [Bacteroidia bacterium]|nr:MAG: hypothetical protein CSB01_01275 [Bacteroidia bacterium]
MNYKTKISVYFLSLLLTIGISCKQKNEAASDEHFITNSDYLKKVEADFAKVKKLAAGRADALFSVFKGLDTKRSEALKFLYAYMPINDLADYNGAFFLQNVNLAFAARDSFSWGASIPEDVFRHFVLPHRVNNENLDSSRAVFFKELYPRIKNMTLTDAALEVNHWCHEQVNYQPTDSRTVSPLGAIKAAFGRCGEESTFAVTALRAVSIPARQVYTPRWAHTDDNHAWVEVYVDGTWKYLGACEPEAVLNKGWFSAPVKRAMMVHTKAFGKYQGSEDVINEKEKYATLNVLQYYAPVKNIWVKVLDENKNPVNNALVEFGLYNYAEYYPLKKQTTQTDGLAHLKTGLGDLRIFASDRKKKFAIQKITVAETDTLQIVLNKNVGDEFSVEYENVPPVEKSLDKIDAAGEEENKRRFAYEDSLRNSYIVTFYTKEKSDKLAAELGLEKDKVWTFMSQSRGNYASIENYLRQSTKNHKDLSVKLLENIAKKDFYDIDYNILLNHIDNFRVFEGQNYPETIVNQYVLNPRVYWEGLSSCRKFLQDKFQNLVKKTPQETIEALIKWTKDNVKIDNENTYYNIVNQPIGTYELKVANDFGRKIFFISTARALGIPARLEPATHTIQYYDDNTWKNIVFAKNTSFSNPDMAKISLAYNNDISLEPLYRVHFGIAKFKDGSFETLHYDWDKPLSKFPDKQELEAGYYQILTGNRLKNGTILTKISFIKIAKDEERKIVLSYKLDESTPKPIAQWKNKLTNNKLTVIGWLDPSTEPGNHFLNDFQALKTTFTEQNINMQIYCANNQEKAKIDKRLPQIYAAKIDDNRTNFKDFYKKSQNFDNQKTLPVFIIVNPKGEVFYFSSGYNIGTSEQILKMYKKLK